MKTKQMITSRVLKHKKMVVHCSALGHKLLSLLVFQNVGTYDIFFCSVIFCGRLDWFWIFGRVFFSSLSIGPDKSRGFSQILAIFTAIYFSFLKHSATRVKLLINNANHASVLESMWRWFVFFKVFFYVLSFQSNLISTLFLSLFRI